MKYLLVLAAFLIAITHVASVCNGNPFPTRSEDCNASLAKGGCYDCGCYDVAPGAFPCDYLGSTATECCWYEP
jgi:hypothetical protein